MEPARGALYVTWLVLLGQSLPFSRRYSEHVVQLLLVFSVVTGALAALQEIRRPYSDGLAAAQSIRKSLGGKPRAVRLLTNDKHYGLVTAAALDAPLWEYALPVKCPFRPGPCPAPAKETPPYPLPCPAREACFYVGNLSPTHLRYAGPGTWEALFHPSSTVSHEDLAVYRYHAEGAALP